MAALSSEALKFAGSYGVFIQSSDSVLFLDSFFQFLRSSFHYVFLGCFCVSIYVGLFVGLYLFFRGCRDT